MKTAKEMYDCTKNAQLNKVMEFIENEARAGKFEVKLESQYVTQDMATKLKAAGYKAVLYREGTQFGSFTNYFEVIVISWSTKDE